MDGFHFTVGNHFIRGFHNRQRGGLLTRPGFPLSIPRTPAQKYQHNRQDDEARNSANGFL